MSNVRVYVYDCYISSWSFCVYFLFESFWLGYAMIHGYCGFRLCEENKVMVLKETKRFGKNLYSRYYSRKT
jgi:hypothetical protein